MWIVEWNTFKKFIYEILSKLNVIDFVYINILELNFIHIVNILISVGIFLYSYQYSLFLRDKRLQRHS